MNLMDQFTVPCAVYRGGTSRGLFFNAADLPKDRQAIQKIFLHGIDAYNPSQINGLGSGTSHSSKVVVIAPPSVPEAEIDYTFFQIGIGEEIVDESGTCGNLMAAVGAYAIDQKLVTPSEGDYSVIHAYNTNIGKTIRLKVPIEGGQVKTDGTYMMAGLKLPGAKQQVEIMSPGGGKLGKTLPLGPVFPLKINAQNVDTSIVDIVNPFVYVSTESLGIASEDLFKDLTTNHALLEQLETIRCEASFQSGLTETRALAEQTPAIPKVALISPPHSYTTASGKKINKDEIDIAARMISMGKFHRTFAGSGLYNLAGSVLLANTIPNQHTTLAETKGEQTIRIGHPDGIAEVRVQLTSDSTDIAYVGLDRTARKIMSGDLYIPKN